MEIVNTVRDSGAFHRQTAAETQTELASLGCVEVFLDSLTSWLMCYCNGNLHAQEPCLFSWISQLSVFPGHSGYRPLKKEEAACSCLLSRQSYLERQRWLLEVTDNWMSGNQAEILVEEQQMPSW